MRFKLARWLSAQGENDSGRAEQEDRSLFVPPTVGLDPKLENPSLAELDEAAEVVDTTLFRAYLLCRPQLVGPLVRRPNRCIPDVVRKMLEQSHVCHPQISLMTEISGPCRVSAW